MDCWCVKPLGEVRGGLQVRLAWKLGARWQAGSGTRSEVFQGWCSLPGQPHCWPWASVGLVQESLCLCWDLGVQWSTPARGGFPFSVAREEMGICVPTFLPMYLRPWPLPFQCNVCMQVTSSGFKYLPSRLDKTPKIYGNCWLLFKQAFQYQTCVHRATGSL